MRYQLCVAAAVAVSAPGLVRAAAPPFALRLEEHRLANGMRVVLAPDSSLGDVTVLVRYAVGSADDPAGKEGLAHVVEHVMFDGSRHVAAGEHVRLLEEAGASKIDGGTGFESTALVETVPPGRVPLALWLESDRMGFVGERLDADTVAREWNAADAEEDETHRTGSGTAGYEAVWGEIFPAGHPYHSAGSIRGGLGVFGLEDVRTFLRTWYSPANATLVVAGHFEPGPTLALAEKYFGSLAAPSTPPRRSAPADWKVPDVRLDVTAAVPYEQVAISWLAPPLGSPGDLELDLAASVLNEPKGRVQRELVDRGLAFGANVWEQSLAEGSVFHLTAFLRPGTDPEIVVTTVERIIADLGATLTPAEAERAQRTWKDALLAGLQTSAGRADRAAKRRPGDDPFALAKYDAIDAQGMASVVRATLVPSHRVVMVVHKVPKSPWYGIVVHREEHAP